MSAKLGEILVRENLVTPQQLREALDYQRTSGGRLGSNLVKLGIISDDVITAVLSRQYGVPSIYARDAEDAFFSAGVLHARDRLWQMELYRRVTLGRLSEVLGDALGRLRREEGRDVRGLPPSRRLQREAGFRPQCTSPSTGIQIGSTDKRPCG